MPAGVKDGVGDDVEVVGVEAGEGVAEVDGEAVGEAGGQAQHLGWRNRVDGWHWTGGVAQWLSVRVYINDPVSAAQWREPIANCRLNLSCSGPNSYRNIIVFVFAAGF